MTGVSCASPGDCSAIGYVLPADNEEPPTYTVAVSESNGVWGHSADLKEGASLDKAGDNSLSSLSCWSPGDCLAVGTGYAFNSYGSGDPAPIYATSTNGAWS